MYLVPTESQNNKRLKLVSVYWVSADGSAHSVGVYNKMNNVFTSHYKKTTAHKYPALAVAVALEAKTLEEPKSPLLELLPRRSNPKA